MNSKKPKSATKEKMYIYISEKFPIPQVVYRKSQQLYSMQKRSIKNSAPIHETYDLDAQQKRSIQVNDSRSSEKLGPLDLHLKSVYNRKKNQSKIQKRVNYIKSALSPYITKSDKGFMKSMIRRMKPVSGPNQSIKQSIDRHKRLNLDNVQVVLRNLKIQSFTERMQQFSSRSGYPIYSKFFITNSKDTFIKRQLLSLGWIQNKNRQSKFYHLKWVVNDSPHDYINLQNEQRFNHFNHNKQLTNKNSLQKNIRKYNSSNHYVSKTILIPMSFDIQNNEQKQIFDKQYDKQMSLSVIKKFVKQIKLKRKEQFQEILSKKQTWYSFLNKCNKIYPIDNPILVESETDTNFMFQMKLITLCVSYLYTLTSEMQQSFQKKLKIPYSRKQWVSNHFSLSKLSSNIKFFGLNAELKTPTNIFIEQVIRIYIHFALYQKTFFSYGENNIWLAKSVGVSRGNGIVLLKQKDKLIESAHIQKRLLQKYIEYPLIFSDIVNPNLKFVEGKKFDLRQWVLVKSIYPLQVYRFDKCYARLCSQKYTNDSNDRYNLQSHLTNYSQNKQHFQNQQQSVISLEQLRSLLPTGVYQKQISPNIDKIIYNTLQACTQNMTPHSSCFQMYGFDLLISQDYKVWLLQVNLSPACEQRTQWMKEDVQQMTQGLLDLVLGYEYKKPKISTQQNHWKLIDQTNLYHIKTPKVKKTIYQQQHQQDNFNSKILEMCNEEKEDVITF